MKFRSGREEEAIDLSISSMIDLTFLLLIFFLVQFSQMKEESELRVSIPVDQQVQKEERVDAPEEVVIDVFPNGEVWWNGQPTDTPDSALMPELKTTLEDLKKAYPDQAVVIRGQRDTLHKRIVAVLNACSYANIDQISFPSDASVFEE